jgi:hypothetical protein
MLRAALRSARPVCAHNETYRGRATDRIDNAAFGACLRRVGGIDKASPTLFQLQRSMEANIDQHWSKIARLSPRFCAMLMPDFPSLRTAVQVMFLTASVSLRAAGRPKMRISLVSVEEAALFPSPKIRSATAAVADAAYPRPRKGGGV